MNEKTFNEFLYNCLSRFDNGHYDAWFEEQGCFEMAEKIRHRLIQELMERYQSSPTNEPLDPILEKAYKNYLRFYNENENDK